MSSSSNWFVYILSCNDKSLYTGITTDLERRVEEHNQGSKGAKYTRARRPVKLVYSESAIDRSSATRRELELKSLPIDKKRRLVQQVTGRK
ncbi:MAG: GIY-YIG nuclease family protein [Sulfuriflexus sp.]|nr:GIY-YIG nuclease family protein [Sulfuriflexus sp.]